MDKHKSVDDRPYGGGIGMIMRVDIVNKALQKVMTKNSKERSVLLDPKGNTLTQMKVRSYARIDHLILICGHYEGIDDRIRGFVDETVSIGDYVLTGGELPAMVITDAVTRLIPGVLSKKGATRDESFSHKDILEYPQFTRPVVYQSKSVPDILLSGNHSLIAEWKKTNRYKKKSGK